MSGLPGRLQELNAERYAAMNIRMRIERHYSRLRSFSPTMRKALAERDIRLALAEAGLPVPKVVPFEEVVARHVRWAQMNPWHVRTIGDMRVRRAVLAALRAEP